MTRVYERNVDVLGKKIETVECVRLFESRDALRCSYNLITGKIVYSLLLIIVHKVYYGMLQRLLGSVVMLICTG